jgi:hypothetical protein
MFSVEAGVVIVDLTAAEVDAGVELSRIFHLGPRRKFSGC